jgi:2-(1,2-epoxy-1,2-dihydrophenyl)acetyl-CoA isomerase
MPTVTCSTDDGLAEIRLDRPDRLNSLDEAMVADFHTALDGVGDARAVLVTAAGRAFSAGRDLTDAEPLTEDAEAILRDLFNPLLQRIADLEVPTIAAVQGACLGVGLGIAFACDVVIAADDARIGSPFARIGAVLDSGGHRYLVERVGPHRALELIYTGKLLSGSEAAAIGLVNRSVPADELDGEARSLARTTAGGPTEAFRESKRIVRSLAAVQLADVLAAEGAAQGRIARTADYAEGITAFQEKRQATFTGR